MSSKNVFILLIFLLSFSFSLYGADGFREFSFGDSPDEIMNAGQEVCRFSDLEKHTRWEWKSHLTCRNYPFTKKKKAYLAFEFIEEELVKIWILSKEIKEFFLIRYPEYSYLTPLKKPDTKGELLNLKDRLLKKDKVHRLGKEYRYTTFFYKGKWEWEYYYEKKGNPKDEQRLIRNQLEKELEAGVVGWNKFKFDDSETETKRNLEGMCSNITVVTGGNNDQQLQCDGFVFLDKKVTIFFNFVATGLVKIELKLTEDWYDSLLNSLKRKYGLPYLELTKNSYYYPSLEFPKDNVVLAFKYYSNESSEASLSLKYLKEGYIDKDQVQTKRKIKGKETPIKKTKSEKLLDSI